MSQNKYLVLLICLILLSTNSCNDTTHSKESKQDKVLLCNLSLPREYKLIFKEKYQMKMIVFICLKKMNQTLK